jgi:hypothetical protein
MIRRCIRHPRTSLLGLSGALLTLGTAWQLWTPEQASALAGVLAVIGGMLRDTTRSSRDTHA